MKDKRTKAQLIEEIEEKQRQISQASKDKARLSEESRRWERKHGDVVDKNIRLEEFLGAAQTGLFCLQSSYKTAFDALKKSRDMVDNISLQCFYHSEPLVRLRYINQYLELEYRRLEFLLLALEEPQAKQEET